MFGYFIRHVLLSKLEGKSNYHAKFYPPRWPGCRGEAQNALEILYDLPLSLAVEVIVHSCC